MNLTAFGTVVVLAAVLALPAHAQPAAEAAGALIPFADAHVHLNAASEAMKFACVQNFLRQLRPAVREQVARGNLLRLVGLAP